MSRSPVTRLEYRTKTLPPATDTNVYLVGTEAFVVIDPAPANEDQQEDLLEAIENRTARGDRLVGLLVTHRHADHVGAVGFLKERTGAPVMAHPRSQVLRPDLLVDRRLADNDEIPIGDWTLHALHTPGHASDHIAYHEPSEGWLFAGDVVPGEGTAIVNPPDGEMTAYFETLERLIDLEPTRIHPAHGPDMEGAEPIRDLLEHRKKREQLVLDAVKAGNESLSDITGAAYPKAPEGLLPLAARSALAHLRKLVVDGQVMENEDRFTLR